MTNLEDAFKSSLEKLTTHAPFYSENDIRLWMLHDFLNSFGPLGEFRLVTEYPVPKSKGHYDIAILNPEGKFFLLAEVKYYYDGFDLNSFKADLRRLQESRAEHKFFICAILEDKHAAAEKKMTAVADGDVTVFRFSVPRWSQKPLT